MLVCSPVQAIPCVEHIIQISNFLNQKNPITFYFRHCLNWKTKTIKESNELPPSICSIEQNGYFSQFTSFETDSGHRGRAETWEWPQAARAEKRTSCSFSSPSPKPHSPLAQKTWSRIMHSWWFCRVSPGRTRHKRFQTGLLRPSLPQTSCFWEQISEQQLLLPLLG